MSKNKRVLNEQQKILLSKKMSYALRHRPDKFGLKLDEFGRVNILVFSEAISEIPENVIDIVNNDKKRRFIISDDDKIFAAQGHSIDVVPDVKKIDVKDLKGQGFAYHGTFIENKKRIFQEGLLKKNRNFVHLTLDKNIAIENGKRWSKNGDEYCLIVVDVLSMIKDKKEVFIAKNEVILTEYVDPKYIKEI